MGIAVELTTLNALIFQELNIIICNVTLTKGLDVDSDQEKWDL